MCFYFSLSSSCLFIKESVPASIRLRKLGAFSLWSSVPMSLLLPVLHSLASAPTNPARAAGLTGCLYIALSWVCLNRGSVYALCAAQQPHGAAVHTDPLGAALGEKTSCLPVCWFSNAWPGEARLPGLIWGPAGTSVYAAGVLQPRAAEWRRVQGTPGCLSCFAGRHSGALWSRGRQATCIFSWEAKVICNDRNRDFSQRCINSRGNLARGSASVLGLAWGSLGEAGLHQTRGWLLIFTVIWRDANLLWGGSG